MTPDSNLGIGSLTNEEIISAKHRLIGYHKKNINDCLWKILNYTDYVNYSEFLDDGKKTSIKKTRKKHKKISDNLKLSLNNMTLDELHQFSAVDFFKKKGLLHI